VIVVLKIYEIKGQRTGQRLVVKTLNPKTQNHKTGQRPFHENLHFFEVFEIIRTDKFSFASNFFPKEMKPTIIWSWDIQTTRINDSLKIHKKNPPNIASYLSNVRWKLEGYGRGLHDKLPW
jgi:hypothetical protein